MPPEQPGTQQEMIQQTWYAVFGSNGDSMWEVMRRIEERQYKLEKRMVAIFTGVTVAMTAINVIVRLL